MQDPDFGSWTATPQVVADTFGPGPAAALHGLLDAPGSPPGIGDDLPALWHWLYFQPAVAQAQLGPDGHARRGSFLPPVELPRRMFVGGRIRIDRPPVVGLAGTRVGLVRSATEKEGRSGSLVFVTVGYDVVDDRNGAVHEEQDLVYREAATSTSPPALKRSVPLDEATWSCALELAIDPVLLFRFSALTYNAHRIHYDRAWATEIEGYPGLVVHGPLQAVALAELCRRYDPARRVTEFSFRAMTPAFDEGPLRLRGRPGVEDSTVELAAFDVHGAATMTATATLAAIPGA